MSKPWEPHTVEAIRQGVVRAIRAGEGTEQAAATRVGVPLAPVRAGKCNVVHPQCGVPRSEIGMDSRLEGRCPPEVAVHEQEAPVACGS